MYINGFFTKFEAVSGDDDFSRANVIAGASCDIGKIRLHKVSRKARNCGIVKVLTQLCLIDPRVNQMDDPNRAAHYLDDSRPVKAGFSSIVGIKQDLHANCEGGLMGLLMKNDRARKVNGGFAYLHAAKDANYQRMVVQYDDPVTQSNSPIPCVEKLAVYDTADVIRRMYNKDTGLIEDDARVRDTRREKNDIWYFCRRHRLVQNSPQTGKTILHRKIANIYHYYNFIKVCKL